MRNIDPYYIEVIAQSWDKDSHGLHDYDPNSTNKEFKLNAQNSFIIGRRK
jgi:hypothetical protein